MIVSTMLVNGTDGIYAASGGASFDHLYGNALALSLAYVVLSVGITTIVVKKQSYK